MFAAALVVVCVAAGVPADIADIVVIDVAADAVGDADAAFFAYADGEAVGAAAALVAGAASTVVGAGLVFVDDDFVRGVGGALVVGGVLAAGAFAVSLAWIPSMLEAGLSRFAAAPSTFVAAERARMGEVIAGSTPLRLTTAALGAAALVTCFFGKAVDNDVVAGAGLGASVSAVSFFVSTSVAVGRARDYLLALDEEGAGRR